MGVGEWCISLAVGVGKLVENGQKTVGGVTTGVTNWGYIF